MRVRAERRAARAKRRRVANELNIVSMIDVLTVLVFFLLVHAINVTTLGIDLPNTRAKTKATNPDPLIVEILPDSLLVTYGRGEHRSFMRNSRHYDVAGLDVLLGDLKKSNPAQSAITVLVAPGIAYGELVAVMDAVRGGPAPAVPLLFPHISLGDAAYSGRGV